MSIPGFFSVGRTIALFRSAGTTPVAKLVLMMFVMAGTMAEKHFFRRDVGIGSNLQDFAGDPDKILRTSSSLVAVRVSITVAV